MNGRDPQWGYYCGYIHQERAIRTGKEKAFFSFGEKNPKLLTLSLACLFIVRHQNMTVSLDWSTKNAEIKRKTSEKFRLLDKQFLSLLSTKVNFRIVILHSALAS